MTEDDIRLEYEADLAWNGEPLKACPICGVETHRKQCATCNTPEGEGITMIGDPLIDKAMAEVQQGKKIDMQAFENALRNGSFEVLKPGEN